MNITEIQARLDALAVAMVAKALRTPTAEFEIRSQVVSRVTLSWQGPGSTYNNEYEFIDGGPEEALAKADAFVADLPSPEEARMKAFLHSLAETIELGKQGDIDVEYVNPLVVMMKRLSKNALEHRVSA